MIGQVVKSSTMATRIIIVIFVVIELCMSEPFSRVPKPLARRYRRQANSVPPSERDVFVMIAALRSTTNILGITMCEDDPYKGIECENGNSTICVPWERVCDTAQECEVEERGACLEATREKYGIENYDECSGEESYSYCQLNYFKVPRCGRDTELRGQEEARISSPGFPGSYDNDVYCFWRLSFSRASQIILNILEFSTEENYDYVTVGEGHNYTTTDQSKLYLSKATGFKEPEEIQINSNKMFVVFSSDSYTSDRGFLFTARAARADEVQPVGPPVVDTESPEVCGGIVEVPADGEVVIQSPNFPDPYSPGLSCDWTVAIQNGGGNLALTVKYLDTEVETDVIQIGRGSDPGENKIETFSGRETPPRPIIVGGDSAWIRFNSDNALQRNGFEIIARDQPFTDCGGSFTVPSGGSLALATPFFPEKGYRVSEICLWQVTGDPGVKLSVNVTFFMVDVSDKVSIGYGDEPAYDWSNYVIAEHSGSRFPEPSAFDSDSNSVWIYFVSDRDYIDRGFKVLVSDSAAFGTGVSVERGEVMEADTDCGYQILREEEYAKIELRSPGTFRYRPLLDCLWEIEVPFGGSVKISFDYFQTEEGRDWLTIGNGTNPNDQSSAVLDKYSGLTRPGVIYGSFQNIWIRFKSDLNNEFRGWILDIEPIPWQECGGEIYVPADGSIAIASPGWPYYYNPRSSCRYTIHGPNNNRVIFTIMEFSTVAGLDTLSIGSGCRPTPGSSIVLDRHSGDSLPSVAQFIPLQDKTWMLFKTTSDYPYTGFLINLADSSIPSESMVDVCEPFEFTTVPPTTKPPPPPTRPPPPEEPKEKERTGPIVFEEDVSIVDYSDPILDYPTASVIPEETGSGMLPEAEKKELKLFG